MPSRPRVIAFDMGDNAVASQHLLDRHFQRLLGEKDFNELVGEYDQDYNIWRWQEVNQLLDEDVDGEIDWNQLNLDEILPDLEFREEYRNDRKLLGVLQTLDLVDEGRIEDVDLEDYRKEVSRLIVTAYEQEEERFMEETGFFEMCRDLEERGYDIAVFTNNSYEGGWIYSRIFERNDIPMEVVLSSDHPQIDVEKGEDILEPWYTFLNDLDAEPEEVVYIGNKKEGDYEAAEEMGLKAVGFIGYRHTFEEDKYDLIGEELESGQIEEIRRGDKAVWNAETVINVVEGKY